MRLHVQYTVYGKTFEGENFRGYKIKPLSLENFRGLGTPVAKRYDISYKLERPALTRDRPSNTWQWKIPAVRYQKVPAARWKNLRNL